MQRSTPAEFSLGKARHAHPRLGVLVLEDVLSLEKLAVFPMGEARRSGQFFRGIWARQGGAGPGWSAAPQGRPPPALLCPKAPTRGRTCSGPHIRGCAGAELGLLLAFLTWTRSWMPVPRVEVRTAVCI